jgi:hypothetical protein
MATPFHHNLTRVQGKETVIYISMNTIVEEKQPFSNCRSPRDVINEKWRRSSKDSSLDISG